jgi:hypothetical protein
MNLKTLIIIACFLAPSCKEATKTSSEESDESVIDGDAWTMAQFSDFFDEDITIEDVKKAFGSDPLVTEEGQTIKLTYALGSQKIYDNGMRIQTIDVIFKNRKFTEFKIGRTGISD